MGEQARDEKHAAMLPGIIEALEERGVEPFTDDELVQLGSGAEEITRVIRLGTLAATRSERWDLTALKLLQRAREAELRYAESDCANLRLPIKRMESPSEPLDVERLR